MYAVHQRRETPTAVVPGTGSSGDTIPNSEEISMVFPEL